MTNELRFNGTVNGAYFVLSNTNHWHLAGVSTDWDKIDEPGVEHHILTSRVLAIKLNAEKGWLEITTKHSVYCCPLNTIQNSMQEVGLVMEAIKSKN